MKLSYKPSNHLPFQSSYCAALVVLLLSLSCDGKAPYPEICQHQISLIEQALKLYEIENGHYPISGNHNMVKALQTLRQGGQPYLSLDSNALGGNSQLRDPWGAPFVYHNNVPKADSGWTPKNVKSFDIYSFGPNGGDDSGEGDDITNWKKP